MSNQPETLQLLSTIVPAPGIVVMMCGIAGSGKTTFAKQLEAKGFIRLSIDEEIWQRFGKYDVDYAAVDYPRHQDTAKGFLRQKLVTLLDIKQPAVLDFSFWNRLSRNEYKQLIIEHGCTWKLIYLRTAPALLRYRLSERSRRFDANAAFPITEDVLKKYLDLFEEPKGEDEVVLEQV